MNRYRFEAADALGRIETGHLEADSQGAAMGLLRSRGLNRLAGPGRWRPGRWQCRRDVQRQTVGQRPGLGHPATGEPAGRQPAAGSCVERDGGAGRAQAHCPDPERGARRCTWRHASGRSPGQAATGLSRYLPGADRSGRGVWRPGPGDGAAGRPTSRSATTCGARFSPRLSTREWWGWCRWPL